MVKCSSRTCEALGLPSTVAINNVVFHVPASCSPAPWPSCKPYVTDGKTEAERVRGHSKIFFLQLQDQDQDHSSMTLKLLSCKTLCGTDRQLRLNQSCPCCEPWWVSGRENEIPLTFTYRLRVLGLSRGLSLRCPECLGFLPYEMRSPMFAGSDA